MTDDLHVATNPDSHILRVPDYKWQWCFNGDWNSLTVNVKTAPCRFHRITQRWILGIHWRKLS